MKPTRIELPEKAARVIKHDIINGLAFVDTSIRNLSKRKPDVADALRICSKGSKKLQDLLSRLDPNHADTFDAKELGYNTTKEETFTSENPEVIRWREFFEERVNSLGIFEGFERNHPGRSIERARAVGTQWYRFSSFMPWFLCQAAAMVSDNEKRHYIIQTAFEELGMRDVLEIHPELFWDAAITAESTIEDRKRLSCENGVSHALSKLKESLLSFKSDDEILGVLLGLEIPAKENIETIFSSLAHTNELTHKLTDNKFFKLHRQIESEHVRLTVANFLRFCQTEEKKNSFIKGFDVGTHFWNQFWNSVGAIIDLETSRETE
jgi:hypothetical protein